MDIKRAKTKGFAKFRKALPASAIATTAIFLTYFLYGMDREHAKAKKDELWIGTVQSGSFEVNVNGYGKLQSKYQRLLTALHKGTVEEILLKPGAKVDKDSVILKLQNPELDQLITNEQIKLNTEKTNLRQQTMNLRREFLAQKAQLAELEVSNESSQMELDAIEVLHKDGLVSNLEFENAKLKKKQLGKRLEIERERLAQLGNMHKESISIQKEKIIQQENLLKSFIQKKDSLTVVAGIRGVLQKLPVELGQSVSEGDQLAVVGGTDKLIALINVGQSQVDNIEIGQTVDISTRTDQADGKVIRIDPVVNEGSVIVEVELVGELPSNARPELIVDAVIHTRSIQNAKFIKSPINTRANTTASLFLLSPEGQSATAVPITFGDQNRDLTQILSGANVGDQFILSDTSLWNDQTKILLN